MSLIMSEKEGDIFIRQLLNIGEAMYQAGGEISRIEDSLHRLGKKYGAKHVSVYAITSLPSFLAVIGKMHLLRLLVCVLFV